MQLRSALLLAAALAGLDATGVAAPLMLETRLYPDALEDIIAIEADESIPSALLDDAAIRSDTGYADGLAVIESSSLDEPLPIVMDTDIPAVTRVPEPENVVLLFAGCAVFAAFGIYRLNYVEPRRRRRHPVRVLTVLR